MTVNRVMLAGRLTRPVELKQTAADAVAYIGLAINRKYQTNSGDKREEAVFVDCKAWGRVAETVAKYLVKGDPVFIEGGLKLDTGEQGAQRRSKLKIIIENFQFVGGRVEAAAAVGHNVDDSDSPL